MLHHHESLVDEFATLGVAGNVINIQTGEWIGIMSGLGAGIDSFFEYLFKVRTNDFLLYLAHFTNRLIDDTKVTLELKE